MEYIVTTNKLSKKFQKQVAVNEVSLHIPQNGVYGLLGANGAGKSTTLKMLTVSYIQRKEKYIIRDIYGNVTIWNIWEH